MNKIGTVHYDSFNILKELTESNIRKKGSDNSIFLGMITNQEVYNTFDTILKFNNQKNSVDLLQKIHSYNFKFINTNVPVNLNFNKYNQLQLLVGKTNLRIPDLVQMKFGDKINIKNINFKINFNLKSMIIDIKSNVDLLFKSYLRNLVKKDGTKKIKNDSIEAYLKTLSNFNADKHQYFKNNNIFTYLDLNEFISNYNKLKTDHEFVMLNKKHENFYTAPLNHYLSFLKLCSNELEFSVEEKDNNDMEKENITGAYNKIYFGAPGTGKSYKIKQDYSKSNGFNTVRTLFHPEYTYNDFIGYLVPKLNQDNNEVEYTYIEGPFTKVLNKALNNPHEKHVLVIEEINRGNASSIFGDLFQLLDRDDNGNSEYSIFNTQIQDQINNKDVHFPKNEIYIPSNMWIVATANTSDQNSFVMDTAFLRRWEMERLDINFNQTDIKNWKFNEKFLPCETWQQFGETINNFLEDHTEELMSEDKLLGQRFIKEKDLNKNSFINKVFRYLWEDVVKLDRTILFNENIKSFKDLANKLNENQYKIVFNQNVLDKFNKSNQTVIEKEVL